MTPEQLAANNSEHGHQTALFCWAALNRQRFPILEFMFAIPNGGERNVIVAANMKAEGARAHVPDIFLPAPVGRWHGLFIEMKRPEVILPTGKKQYAGTIKEGQTRWHDALGKLNYGMIVCYTWIEARDAIIQYLEWK